MKNFKKDLKIFEKETESDMSPFEILLTNKLDSYYNETKKKKTKLPLKLQNFIESFKQTPTNLKFNESFLFGKEKFSEIMNSLKSNKSSKFLTISDNLLNIGEKKQKKLNVRNSNKQNLLKNVFTLKNFENPIEKEIKILYEEELNENINNFFHKNKKKQEITTNGSLFLNEEENYEKKKIEKQSQSNLNIYQSNHIKRIRSAKTYLTQNQNLNELKSNNKIILNKNNKYNEIEKKFPEWVYERDDFKNKLNSADFNLELKLIKITEKPYYKRNSDEKEILYNYLMKLEIFSFFSKDSLDNICMKIKSKFYEQNQIIIHQSEINDQIMIIYKGQIGLINDSKLVVQTLINKDIIPRYIYVNEEKTYCGVKTLTPTYFLIISRLEYENIIRVSFLNDSEKFKNFLKSIPIITEMDENKIIELMRNLKPLLILKNEYVYKKGNQCDALYILYQGTLLKNILIYLEDNYKFPTGLNSWKIKKIIKTIKHPITYQKGSIVGSEEMIEGGVRKHFLQVEKHSVVLELNRLIFFEVFKGKYLTLFKECFYKKVQNLEEIAQEELIEGRELEKKKLKLLTLSINSNLNKFLPTNSTQWISLLQKEQKLSHWYTHLKNKKDENYKKLDIVNVEKIVKDTNSKYEI